MDIFEKKYGLRIAKEEVGAGPAMPYSDEYQKFKKTETSGAHSFYEAVCHFAEKIISPKLDEDKREELASVLRLTHLEITPESVYSLAYICMALTLILGLAFIFFILSIYSILAVLVLAPSVFFLVKGIPQGMLKRWRVAASSQLVSAVLYMIVDIKQGSNLERSVYFTANRVAPPLSLDFMRILWEFQVGKYSTVQEALDVYTTVWKGVEDEFVDSIHLIISALHQKGKQADKTLDKATDVVLEGVQDHMRHFAHELAGPVSALHMLGIVLPILLLIMLPLVASFFKIPWYSLVLVFDIGLPLVIYTLAKRILSMRPGGISYTTLDVYLYSRERKEQFLGILSAVGVFLLFCAAGFGYFLFERARGADFSKYTDPIFYLSLIGTAAIGFTIITYLYVSNRKSLKAKRELERMENEFSSAAFQLGSRIDEGTPPELAFEKVARDTKGMEIQHFFSIVDYNLRTRNMSLKEAIFDSRMGAIRFYPSPTIRSVMQLLVEGAKRSLKAAAGALLVLSRYLRDTRRVYERMKDLLAETISSMQMQAGYFTAIIIAIVTALATMIVRVMSSLSGVLRGGMFGGQLGSVGGVGTLDGYEGLQSISQIFNADSAVAAYQFQLIVGIYLVLVILLLSYVLALVIHGGDRIERKHIMASNLFKSIVIYLVVVIVTHTILNSITKNIISGMVTT